MRPRRFYHVAGKFLFADCQRQPLHGLTLTRNFCRGALRASVQFHSCRRSIIFVSRCGGFYHYVKAVHCVAEAPQTVDKSELHGFFEGSECVFGGIGAGAAMRATHFFVFFEKNRGDVLHATKIYLSLHRQSTMESLGKPNFGFFS